MSLVVAVWLSLSAWASECPVDDMKGVSVEATGNEVLLDGRVYSVRRRYGEDEFARMLRACNAPEAAHWFEAWRTSKRKTGLAIGLAVPFVVPWLVVPYSAGNARAHRERMLWAIRRGA